MGSSAKKKKEKKKDFQKVKLRVGKTKAQAANFTDTSFKAKSIVLNQQSLSTNAPSTASQFSHHLSLLSHKADSQRRESLAYLTSAILSTPDGSAIPQPVAVILPEVQRLILDASNSVRHQLLKLLQSLPVADIASHADQLLLYTRAGLTHLAADIRLSSLDIFDWLLQVAGTEVVSCAGGWVKTLKCFLGLLGWETDSTGKWSAPKATLGKAGSQGKLLVKQISSLGLLVRIGLVPEAVGSGALAGPWPGFPVTNVEQHMITQRSYVYRHLNIFSTPRDDEAEMYEDREDRQRVFNEKAETAIVAGLEQAKKSGGEVGRAAAQLRKAVLEGMADFQGAEREASILL
ncbi:pre-rRNA-processing protein ipi1 [Lophium mytilinum]|uniref:Pre-rRNA-processing protein n=1 Tax=Lophium mytilinum TaxID=390894 RepID=A0A6A6QNP4_9PEZI|nr:pre-rRNA-processing protein ipi1 [Lophium mytilinum]